MAIDDLFWTEKIVILGGKSDCCYCGVVVLNFDKLCPKVREQCCWEVNMTNSSLTDGKTQQTDDHLLTDKKKANIQTFFVKIEHQRLYLAETLDAVNRRSSSL